MQEENLESLAGREVLTQDLKACQQLPKLNIFSNQVEVLQTIFAPFSLKWQLYLLLLHLISQHILVCVSWSLASTKSLSIKCHWVQNMIYCTIQSSAWVKALEKLFCWLRQEQAFYHHHVASLGKELKLDTMSKLKIIDCKLIAVLFLLYLP